MLHLFRLYIKQWLGIARKGVLVILFFAVLSALFAHFINRDKIRFATTANQENRKAIYGILNDPQLSKTAQGKLAVASYRVVVCALVGEGCTNNPSDGDQNFYHSVVGSISKVIAAPMANPPASGVLWALNGLQSAGFIPKAMASEGLGFGVIQPFAKIWVVFRDLAYVALVLVIVVAGFMIMFRMKLNPQTVISIENALPRVIVSLIIITFSFAIAGFLIDLMYLSIAVIIAVLQPAGGYDIVQVQQRYIQAHPAEILGGIQNINSKGVGQFGFTTIFWFLPNALLDLVPLIGGTVRAVASVAATFWIFPELAKKWDFLKAPLDALFGIDLGGGISAVIADAKITAKVDNIVSKLTTNIWSSLMIIVGLTITSSILVPFAIGLAIFLTVVFIFFRIFFMLFITYGKILLSVIIAPLYLLFEAIPGQSAFSNWIKGLIAELITFPVVVTIFLIGSIIFDNGVQGNFVQFPFLVGIDPKSFSYILGMLLLFMTPDLVKAVKTFIVPKPGLIDTMTGGGLGVGAFFGGATTGFNTGLGEISKYGSFAYYFAPAARIIDTLGLGKVINVGGHTPPGPPKKP